MFFYLEQSTATPYISPSDAETADHITIDIGK